MDRYKFRGKRLDNGEWVAGHYLTRRTKDEGLQHMISYQDMWGFHEVDPTTVGQVITYYGKEFAKGDLIAIPCYCDSEYGCSHGDGIYEFCWNQEIAGYALRLKGKGRFESLDNYDVDDMTVIGNRWDNPELLE